MLLECLAIAKDPICSTPLLAMVLALAFFQNVHQIKVSLDWILKPELRELGALSTTAGELASLTLNTQWAVPNTTAGFSIGPSLMYQHNFKSNRALFEKE